MDCQATRRPAPGSVKRPDALAPGHAPLRDCDIPKASDRHESATAARRVTSIFLPLDPRREPVKAHLPWEFVRRPARAGLLPFALEQRPCP